jgi:hypothetical protein
LLDCANALHDLGALLEESPQFIVRSLDDHLNSRDIAIRMTSVAVSVAAGDFEVHETSSDTTFTIHPGRALQG